MKRPILKWRTERKMGSESDGIKMDHKDEKMCATIG
jgi:hypothetical protein